MISDLFEAPAVVLCATVVIFLVANWLFQASGRMPLLNAVLVSVVALSTILLLLGIPYERYFKSAQFIHLLLGPAVVALAVPLRRNLGKIRERPLAILATIVAGSLVSAGSASLIAYLFGAEAGTVASIAPKSVTAPVAMGISAALGGQPPLATVLAVVTGILASFRL